CGAVTLAARPAQFGRHRASERPAASRLRTHDSKPTPPPIPTSPDRFVRAAAGRARASPPMMEKEKLVWGCHVPCFSAAALPLRSGQRQIWWRTPSGSRCAVVKPIITAPPAACSIFFIFFREKMMKKIKKIEQAASRWWYLLVGIRWQRLQGPVLALY